MIDQEEKKISFLDRLPSSVYFIFDLIKIIVIALIVVWPIHRWIIQPFLVSGPSMEPNFYNQEYLIVEEVSYHFRQPARGEVVVFRSKSSRLVN